MTTRTPSPRTRPAAAGEEVIDLTDERPPDPRIADYEQAFGLPSALHHHTLPEVVSKLGFGGLWSRVTGRSRH